MGAERKPWPPSLWDLLLDGGALEEQERPPKWRRHKETNLEEIPKHGDIQTEEGCRDKNIEVPNDTLALRKSTAKGRWLQDTLNKQGG